LPLLRVPQSATPFGSAGVKYSFSAGENNDRTGGGATK
jgi:hypothetical protein